MFLVLLFGHLIVIRLTHVIHFYYSLHLRKSSSRKMRQTIINHSESIMQDLESTSKSEVTPSELNALISFTKAFNTTFTEKG